MTPLSSGSRWLALLLALLVFRLWFAAALPMTGDEAYFVLWGERLAGGYYDHPPMIGWWLSGLLHFGRAEWWLRLPSVLLPFLLAWSAWSLLRAQSVERARLAALLVLLQPADVWNVLITTDTPVVLFSVLSVLAYIQGVRRASPAWHALAGLLLGAAFLGKYFAALLGFAFAAHLLFARRDRGRWSMFAILTVFALLGPAWNLWWNSNHCWTNILFNFFNRTERSGFAWQNPLFYVASLAYLATPWLLWALWRERRGVVAALRDNPLVRAMAWLAGVPLAIFFLMSFAKSVGLHWLLAFMPMLAVLAAAVLPVALLQRLLLWSAILALLHVLAAILLISAPLTLWQGSSLHAGAVLTLRGDLVAQSLREPLARCGEGCVLATESYSSSATLAYAVARPVVVFGNGSFHGRQDDFATDFRALDGRDFLLLRKESVQPEKYVPFFEHVTVSMFELEGVAFHVVHGQGFRYDAYREHVLARVRDRFYRMQDLPGWLPLRACGFVERYFPVEGRN